MPQILASTHTTSAVVQYEELKEYGYCRKVVTVNEATAKTYLVGAVLGKVTAGGKYKIQDSAAVDGSQTFAGIFVGFAGKGGKESGPVAATTDVQVVILYRGRAIVGKSYLVFGAGTTVGALMDAQYALMEAAGIQVIAYQSPKF
jgi:hypothetical protein